MKDNIHPNYQVADVSCACGNTFQTRSTLAKIKVDICSACHPFYTGQQKLIDSAGRVEKFSKRFAKTGGKTVSRTKKVQKRIAAPLLKLKAKKVLTSTPVAGKKPTKKPH